MMEVIIRKRYKLSWIKYRMVSGLLLMIINGALRYVQSVTCLVTACAWNADVMCK
jgi:hypothetical protein